MKHVSEVPNGWITVKQAMSDPATRASAKWYYLHRCPRGTIKNVKGPRTGTIWMDPSDIIKLLGGPFILEDCQE